VHCKKSKLVNHVHSADDECEFDSSKVEKKNRVIVLCTKCNPAKKMDEIKPRLNFYFNIFNSTYHCDKHGDRNPTKWFSSYFLFWEWWLENENFKENTKEFKTHSFKRNAPEK
jgi:hypothetical protein